MPEVNQFAFSNAELLEMLIKKADVHEGRWVMMVNFGITTGSMGPAPDQLAPGFAVTIANIGIQRAPADAPAQASVDAALLNPANKRGSKS